MREVGEAEVQSEEKVDVKISLPVTLTASPPFPELLKEEKYMYVQGSKIIKGAPDKLR